MANSDPLTIFTAALLHDLARDSHTEDAEHGQAAVTTKRYRLWAERVLTGDDALHSCYNAVTTHCRSDDVCEPKDATWCVLKDADALDRGRFKEHSCDLASLRGFTQDASPSTVRTMAHHLAKMTTHVNWGDRPCRKLLETVQSRLTELDGQKIPLEKNARIRSEQERRVTKELIDSLSEVKRKLDVID